MSAMSPGETTVPGQPALGTPATLAKLIDDLGSRSEVVGIVRTFIATLAWRASRIERSIRDGQLSASTAVLQDLRNAALMVGAEAIALWCATALTQPARIRSGAELVELAGRTQSWCEAWLGEHDTVA